MIYIVAPTQARGTDTALDMGLQVDEFKVVEAPAGEDGG